MVNGKDGDEVNEKNGVELQKEGTLTTFFYSSNTFP